MSTPLVIDQGAPNFAGQRLDGNRRNIADQGPFEYNGFKYVMYRRWDVNANTYKLAVVKSNDGFATAASLLDSTNAPTIDANLTVATCKPAAEDVLYFAFVNPSTGAINLGSFDFTADAYGALITGGPVPAVLTHDPQSLHAYDITLTKTTGGDFLIPYFTTPTVSTQGLSLALYSSGWSSIIVATSGIEESYDITAALADTALFMYAQRLGSPTFAWQMVFGRVNADRSVDTFATFSDPNGSNIDFGRLVYNSDDDTAILPVYTSGDLFGSDHLNLLKIFTASGAATFDLVGVAAASTAGITWGAPDYLVNGSGSFYVALLGRDNAGNSAIHIWLAGASGGPYNEQALFWEYNANPPAGANLGEKDPPLNFHFVTGGDIASVLIMGASAGVICLQQYYLAGPVASIPPSDLAVACPLQSPRLHVAYSSEVIASGGTLPYSFAVTAGALPAGLALDASTGLITGTPTLPGAYSYQITVTDEEDDTADVTCSGVIPCSAVPDAGITGYLPARD